MDVKLDSPKPINAWITRLFTFSLPRWLWLPLLVFSVTRLGVVLVAYLAVQRAVCRRSDALPPGGVCPNHPW